MADRVSAPIYSRAPIYRMAGRISAPIYSRAMITARMLALL
jgi:hypothetical protein